MKKKLTVLMLLLVFAFAGIAQAVVSGTFAQDAVNDSRVIGYNLYWGTSSGNQPNKLDARTATQLPVTGLPDNVPLYLVATAYSVDQESDPSPELVVYTIKATAPTNGTISPAGNTLFAKNTAATYTISPANGYVVKDVQVDGVSVGKVTSYTFSSLAACHTITATFDTKLPAPKNLRLATVIASIYNLLFANNNR